MIGMTAAVLCGPILCGLILSSLLAMVAGRCQMFSASKDKTTEKHKGQRINIRRKMNQRGQGVMS